MCAYLPPPLKSPPTLQHCLFSYYFLPLYSFFSHSHSYSCLPFTTSTKKKKKKSSYLIPTLQMTVLPSRFEEKNIDDDKAGGGGDDE